MLVLGAAQHLGQSNCGLRALVDPLPPRAPSMTDTQLKLS